MRVAYIFTTFPKLSEQFFMREVIELRRQGLSLDIYSMIGGQSVSEAGPVRCMSWVDWLCFVLELFYWLSVRPVLMLGLMRRLLFTRYGSWTNRGENLLGFACAVRFARRFKQLEYTFSHATWATGPGMAVYALKALIGQAYTLEAHAYDVFRDGGDAFLKMKLEAAHALRSSTDATTRELQQCLGAGSGTEVVCVRRGLTGIPQYRAPIPPEVALEILSVGRLIEKKGYLHQLQIYAQLMACGIPFHAGIVGEGPLYAELERNIEALGLSAHVTLTGKLEYAQVEALYAQANLFLFTGLVSASGDRDGFPNVIGEAMAHSVPVFTTDVSGTTEGVPHGICGTVIDSENPEQTAAQILAVMQDTADLKRLTRAAYDWVLSDFQVGRNVQKLRAALWGRSKGVKE
jgi:glycosyltransferase involved in cell wall biosynthesis